MPLLGGKKRAGILIAAGLALMVVGGSMLFSYEKEGTLAGENARILLVDLRHEMELKLRDVAQTAVKSHAVGQMPQIVVDGYATVGILSIESVGVCLPVLDDWSYELLQVAPCRYSGTAEDGNLILLGHSYQEHFQPLEKVQLGDAVEFCDTTGRTYLYEVVKTEVLGKYQLDELTNSGYDLTLFTCTFTGESRHVVRCALLDA